MSVSSSPYAYLVLRKAINEVLGVEECVLAVHTLQALRWGEVRQGEGEGENKGEVEGGRGPETAESLPPPN